MPAPMISHVPTASNGGPAPGFVPGYNGMGTPTLWSGFQGMGGMGDMMSMNQVNPGPAAAAGAQPWQGPWLNMDEMTAGAPLDLAAQSFEFQQPTSGLGGAAPATMHYPGQYPGGLAGAAPATMHYPGQYPGGLAGGHGRRRGGKMFMGILVGAALMYFALNTRMFR